MGSMTGWLAGLYEVVCIAILGILTPLTLAQLDDERKRNGPR